MEETGQGGPSGKAFALLHPTIQEQLFKTGWKELRPIQVDAIHAVMETNLHVLIMAATAGGKTEAAFLPILSSIRDMPAGGVKAVYVGPLKALINDQFRRLEDLCALAEIPVMKWHGDVGASVKRDFLKTPSGVLLITPESIESLFINHPTKVRLLFSGLAFVVVDEVHAFVGSERGAHLRSLLSRIRQLCRVPPRLIGLSATVGDPRETAAWINRDSPDDVRIISDATKRSVKYLVKGYVRDTPAHDDAEDAEPGGEIVPTAADARLAEDILRHLNKTSLVFANAKARIEFLADQVRAIESRLGVPDRVGVHHGSLSKAEREQTEADLRSDRPTLAFCSSTLEMGIDVGEVKAVGQVGPPWSVSSLAQRLGRSGRKPGESAVMFLFVQEDLPHGDADPVSRLYPELLQSVAMTELLLQKWCEPPPVRKAHLSTFVQQIMSVVTERGGASASALFDTLVTRGSFRDVDQQTFVKVLRSLGNRGLLEQTPEGDIIIGLQGEPIVRSADFYASFMGTKEMDVIHAGRRIGSVAAAPGTGGDGFIILAGRRWKVLEIDERRLEILVEPSRGGRLPTFAASGGGDIHHAIRQQMREAVTGSQMPVYLDAEAKEMLSDARKAAEGMGLGANPFVQHGKTLFWFTWAGSAINRTLTAVARYGADLRCWDAGIAIGFDKAEVADVRLLCTQFVEAPTPAEELALTFPIKATEKYDEYLEDGLQVMLMAESLDVDGAIGVAKKGLQPKHEQPKNEESL